MATIITSPHITSSEHVALVGWGSFADLRHSILPRLFGEMVKRANPVVKEFHGDLFHDAEWLRQNVTGPISFDFLVRHSGTNIGETARIMAGICSVDDGVLYNIMLAPDDRRYWHATFTTLAR